MKVFSVGEMLIDFLPGSEAGTYVRKAGGAPANAAIALARQGCDTSVCGMLGTMILVASCWRHCGKIMSRRSCA